MLGRGQADGEKRVILMFDNDTVCIRWHAVNGARIIKGACRFSPAWPDRIAASIGSQPQFEAIGYFLHHGGNRIKKSVGLLTPQNFCELEDCVKFLPECNDLTGKIASYWLKALPHVPHILLCDTAFFSRLPHAALNYAIPHRLQQQDIRRYGRYGLGHHWASWRVQPYLRDPRANVISVYLGDHTNIAALKGRRPLETSCGFTPIEGMLSLTGSGSIDPTIIFYLHSAGMSFREINELLSQKSGLAALLGKKSGLSAILNGGRNKKIMAARDFYCYNLSKWIGGFAAILGGVDALVFFSERPRAFKGIIDDLGRRFAFLGLKLNRATSPGSSIMDLTGPSSAVKVFCLEYSPWKVMEEHIGAMIKTRRTLR